MIYSKVHNAIKTRELVRIKAKIGDKYIAGSLARVDRYLGESFYLLTTVPDSRELVVHGDDIIINETCDLN